MNKRHSTGRGAVIVLSLAGVAVSASGIVHAGPGCMSDQRLWRGYYPHGPVAPPAAYSPAGRYVQRAAPVPYVTGMPGPFGRPVAGRQADAAADARPDTSGRPVAGAAQSARLAVSSGSESAGEAVTVRISGMRFEPARLSVKPGTVVTWVQDDGMPHVISGNAGGLRSNTLYTGQQFSFIFQKPGSYDYVCDLHPSMQGSVVVEEPGTGT